MNATRMVRAICAAAPRINSPRSTRIHQSRRPDAQRACHAGRARQGTIQLATRIRLRNAMGGIGLALSSYSEYQTRKSPMTLTRMFWAAGLFAGQDSSPAARLERKDARLTRVCSAVINKYALTYQLRVRLVLDLRAPARDRRGPAPVLARLRPQVAQAAPGDSRRRSALVGRRVPGGPFWREHERAYAPAHRIVPAVRLRARARHGRGHRPLDPYGSGSPAARVRGGARQFQRRIRASLRQCGKRKASARSRPRKAAPQPESRRRGPARRHTGRRHAPDADRIGGLRWRRQRLRHRPPEPRRDT